MTATKAAARAEKTKAQLRRGRQVGALWCRRHGKALTGPSMMTALHPARWCRPTTTCMSLRPAQTRINCLVKCSLALEVHSAPQLQDAPPAVYADDAHSPAN